MTADAPLYAGYYINLDRSPERRREIEAGLDALGILGRYHRFPGIDGAVIEKSGKLKPGEVGCYRSHYEALRLGEATGLPVHVLEDDVLFSNNFDKVAETILSKNLLDRYDILFTDTFVPSDPHRLSFLKKSFDRAMKGPNVTYTVMDMRQTYLCCASSYFVNPASVGKVAVFLARELSAGPEVMHDILFRKLAQAGELRIGCCFPFTTSVRLEHIMATTIVGREAQIGNLSVLAAALLRYSFFVERDLEGYAKKFLGALNDGAERKPDTHKDLLMDVLEFTLSVRYQGF